MSIDIPSTGTSETGTHETDTGSTGAALVAYQAHLPSGGDRHTGSTGSPHWTEDRPVDDEHGDRRRVVIIVNEGEFRDITAQAVRALVIGNIPEPTVFKFGAALARLRHQQGRAFIEPLDIYRLLNHMGEVADWRRLTFDKYGNPILDIVRPDKQVVSNVLAEPDWPLPPVERVVHTPVFAPDGSLIVNSGYHEEGRLYLATPPGLTVPWVTNDPSPGEVDAAKTMILNEVLGDFPFVTEADVAHSVAAMLLPFVRAMIPGPTPFHLINAPTKGTGKTLLAEMITRPSAGKLGVSSEARSEEEWRKRIGALLSSGPAVIWIDNIKQRLDTGALAAVLTEDLWVDRLLGRNDATIRYPNKALWIGTGNGVTLSDELVRRTIPIHLDSHLENPFLRPTDQFRHPDLRDWVTQNRGMLIWSACTLIQRWIADGQPVATKTIGSFESWAKIMGGILGNVGIDGFLGNLDEFYSQADPETAAWRAFVAAWWETYADALVHAGDLLGAYDSLRDDFLGLSDKSDRIRATTLGNKLLSERNRIFGGCRLHLVDKNQGGNRWRLMSEA